MRPIVQLRANATQIKDVMSNLFKHAVGDSQYVATLQGIKTDAEIPEGDADGTGASWLPPLVPSDEETTLELREVCQEIDSAASQIEAALIRSRERTGQPQPAECSQMKAPAAVEQGALSREEAVQMLQSDDRAARQAAKKESS